jgi:hypothetical protein
MATYNLLEPKITQEIGGAPLGFDTARDVSLFATTEFLFTTSIMLIIGVAAGRYMLAGVWRIEASERGVRKSNEEIKRVTLGLLGVLSLFVILYTFNKGLLLGDVGLAGLGSGTTPTSQLPVETKVPPQAVTNGTEQANRDALTAQGITVNNPPCTATKTTECTNLADLPQSAMSMLIQLKDSCPGSSVVVTGGTEPGHKTHGPGKAVIDIRIGDEKLDSCISKFVLVNPPLAKSWCNRAYRGLGFTFCDEVSSQPHWHAFK